MPNYDFQCTECDHKFSRIVSIDEKKNVKCPQCDSNQIKQLYTGFAVIGNNNSNSTSTCSSSGG